jgi:hypothetical protein
LSERRGQQRPLEQAMPQPPQFEGSSKFEQPDAQHVSPLAHVVPLHVHALFVHPFEVADEHTFGHVIVWPQLLVAWPQALPLQAVVLSGVQHVLPAVHTSAFGHVGEQVTGCMQLFITVVLHLPAHAATLSGMQQLLPTHTWLDEEQLAVPPAPHDTVWPQLFVAVPHVFPAQVVDKGSGTQPQEPLVHVSPASHPPHMTVRPQLSVLIAHRFWHHVDGDVGVQQLPFAVQTPPSPHAGQVTVSPQLLTAVVLHLVAHGSSGVQHVWSGLHTSEFEAQDVEPPAPQATL